MHIHEQFPNVSAAGFFGISSGDRAAQARRAAETRKKLLKASQAGTASEIDPDAELLVDCWMGIGAGQGPLEDEDTSASDHDFGSV